jgi:flagellar biosynthesis/type III secretory pathway protein FliH
MLETTIHFGHVPTSICVIDANAAPLDIHAADNSRHPAESAATIAAAEMARQTHERELIAQMLERLNEIAGQLGEQRQQLLHEMKHVAIELAVAVASQAIHAKIQAGDFPIEALTQAAIERLGNAGAVVVHLHPEDLALLERRLGDGRGQTLKSDIRFEPDGSMNRGDCRADAGEMGVWCKMQSQLEEMRQCLLEGLGDAEIERRKTAGGDSGLRRFPDRRQTA